MRKVKEKSGISLIVLVITIIVIIILAVAVILSIAKNNPIEEAKIAKYENDVDNMQALLTSTITKIMADTQGTVKVIAGEIDNETGKISYTLTGGVNSKSETGAIYFDKGKNTDIAFYTGSKLPIYSSEGTKWYVDDKGKVAVKVGKNTYGEGETVLLEGAGQTYHTLAPSTLTFRSTAELDEFQEVQINGETIDPSNYTLKEGSTIVTLSIDYLKTLDANKHEITVVSESGAPSVEFEIIEPKLNKYNFYYNQPYTAYVDALGVNMGFFLREDGTVVILAHDDLIDNATYTFDGDNITCETAYGTYTQTVSNDGTAIYCNELGTNFVLGGKYIVADADYFYLYTDELDGYTVRAIDKTKSSYGAIKNGINGYRTVKLAEDMFKNNDKLTEFPEIPQSSIQYVGEGAFYGCSNLRNVKLPDSVKDINFEAFALCSSLTNIDLPPYITGIYLSTFKDCSSLTRIDLPDTVGIIKSYAFSGCTSLQSVTFWNTVTGIGANAFSGCTSLNSITFLGTMEDWNQVTLDNTWNSNSAITTVKCYDGTVTL